jgi:hypothetical protein
MELAKLKLLLGITDESKNDLLQFCLDDVTESVLNYCNLTALPTGLENTAYRMAMELYRNENFGSTAADNGIIASKSAGDTSVSFRVNTDYTESLLKDYQKQLNKYRRLSWT